MAYPDAIIVAPPPNLRQDSPSNIYSMSAGPCRGFLYDLQSCDLMDALTKSLHMSTRRTGLAHKPASRGTLPRWSVCGVIVPKMHVHCPVGDYLSFRRFQPRNWGVHRYDGARTDLGRSASASQRVGASAVTNRDRPGRASQTRATEGSEGR